MVRLFALLFMSVFCTSYGQGQPDLTEAYIKSEFKDTVTSYGPNRMVLNVKQAKNGDILIAAYNGVFQYDGKSVTNLKPMDLFQDGPKPKAHNWGWPQLQDKNGNIWFSNWGGAYRYDGNTFTSFTTKDGLPSEVTRIIEDKKGNLWFGASDGLRRYDGKTFTYFKDGLINPWIWEILEDKNGNLWVGTRESGIYFFDGEKFISYSEYKQ